MMDNIKQYEWCPLCRHLVPSTNTHTSHMEEVHFRD